MPAHHELLLPHNPTHLYPHPTPHTPHHTHTNAHSQTMGYGAGDSDPSSYSMQQQQPSAPPLLLPQQQQQQQQAPPGYPPIVAPGVPVIMHPSAVPQQQQPQQQQSQQYPQPHVQPPAVHVVEQLTTHYVTLPLPGDMQEPLITRSSCARPRLLTCPACFTMGPTVVERQSGCCAYLACFALCWVCCPLAWLPLCLDCDKDIVHRCAACGAEVARVPPCS